MMIPKDELDRVSVAMIAARISIQAAVLCKAMDVFTNAMRDATEDLLEFKVEQEESDERT